jgi:hypothetical protein
VAPEDALDVINYINAIGPGPDPLAPNNYGYLDVTADGYVSAIDALTVINTLNAIDKMAQMSAAPATASALSAPGSVSALNDALLAVLSFDAYLAGQTNPPRNGTGVQSRV